MRLLPVLLVLLFAAVVPAAYVNESINYPVAVYHKEFTAPEAVYVEWIAEECYQELPAAPAPKPGLLQRLRAKFENCPNRFALGFLSGLGAVFAFNLAVLVMLTVCCSDVIEEGVLFLLMGNIVDDILEAEELQEQKVVKLKGLPPVEEHEADC